MQLLKVGAAVLNQTPLAWDSNKSHILAAIEAARKQRVSLLCLPELCISGYGCEDAFLSPAVQRMAWRVLAEIVPDTRGIDRLAGPAAAVQQRAVQRGVPGGRMAGFWASPRSAFWPATASITSRAGSSPGRLDGELQ